MKFLNTIFVLLLLIASVSFAEEKKVKLLKGNSGSSLHIGKETPHYCLGAGAFVEPFRGGIHGRIWYNDLFGGQVKLYGEWNSHGGGGFLLEGMAKLPIEYHIKPYVTIGTGYHWQKIDTVLNTQPLKEALGFATFRIAVGGEMRIGPGERQSLSAELGYFRGTADYYQTISPIGNPTTFIDTNTFRLKPLTAKVLYTYYFCKERPIDSDKDGDGILDSEDRCRYKPEDKDGYLDSDGCPDFDNDNDGIPDTEDKCPLAPEDEEGFQDEDGCPDFDNDNDGIPDTTDICPDIPETKNGFEDEDGCKDEAPAEAKKPLILEGVNFESGSDVITKESYPKLDAVAESFKDWSDVHVEIQGHTDNVGSENANMILSEKRAVAIMNYLITRGIAKERLTAVGFGESKPIADNKTTAGRAKNRRVELKRKN